MTASMANGERERERERDGFALIKCSSVLILCTASWDKRNNGNCHSNCAGEEGFKAIYTKNKKNGKAMHSSAAREEQHEQQPPLLLAGDSLTIALPYRCLSSGCPSPHSPLSPWLVQQPAALRTSICCATMSCAWDLASWGSASCSCSSSGCCFNFDCFGDKGDAFDLSKAQPEHGRKRLKVATARAQITSG